MFYYESSNGSNLFWSETELTKVEQRELQVHNDFFSVGRLYDKLCVRKKGVYHVLPIEARTNSTKYRGATEIFVDPDHPRLRLLRYTVVK